MNDVTIRKRTGTLQRGTAGMKRSTPEDDEKSLPNKVDSEKSGEELEEWKLRPLSEAPKNDSHWAKNVEEGLSDIIKRLDQITVHRNHLPAIIPNLSADLRDTGVVSGENGPVVNQRNVDKNALIKERNRLLLRNEQLISINEKLSEENRLWKTRYDEVINQYRRLKHVCAYPVEELKFAISDPTEKVIDLKENKWRQTNDGWLSLWNVLPHLSPVGSIPAPINPAPSSNKIHLRCLQVNLQHRKKSMERTKRIMIERNIDIALIQEPYAIGQTSPELYGVPVGYTAFHNLTENHTQGTAIIAKNSLRAKLCNYGRNEVTGLQIRYGDKFYHFYSVFCTPSCANVSTVLSPLLDQTPQASLVIAMDASARHPKWNNGMVYRKIDQRGKEIRRLLSQYALHLANQSLFKLNYGPGNYACIDVTLGGDRVHFHDWKYWEDSSLSEHPFIFFQVE